MINLFIITDAKRLLKFFTKLTVTSLMLNHYSHGWTCWFLQQHWSRGLASCFERCLDAKQCYRFQTPDSSQSRHHLPQLFVDFISDCFQDVQRVVTDKIWSLLLQLPVFLPNLRIWSSQASVCRLVLSQALPVRCRTERYTHHRSVRTLPESVQALNNDQNYDVNGENVTLTIDDVEYARVFSWFWSTKM